MAKQKLKGKWYPYSFTANTLVTERAIVPDDIEWVDMELEK